MKDRNKREIDYMRISITDRCNLHCRYCMPDVAEHIAHDEILRYEEILRICRAAVDLGIHKFKITGGEPLVRKGAVSLIGSLRALPGVECVTLTTNGVLLYEALDALIQAGLDGVNISMDAISPDVYEEITGQNHSDEVKSALHASVQRGLKTKINVVLLNNNKKEWIRLASLAEKLTVDVRFIELMPVGCAGNLAGPGVDEAYAVIKKRYGDLHFSDHKRGNGPAVYFTSEQLMGSIGLIGANSHRFCDRCNRIRLTSTGEIKPCLSYENSVDLKGLLRGGADDAQLRDALRQAILSKPAAHCFLEKAGKSEGRPMNQIGG